MPENGKPATSHGHKEGKILIGYRFLEKYKVVLNYPAGEMILLPTGAPFEHNIPSWGLALTIKDHKTVVSGVWQGSEAVKQGLQPGDEIVAINSVKMSTIHTVGELILMFFADKEQRSITVEFVHESERKTVVLHKKDLLPALKNEALNLLNQTCFIANLAHRRDTHHESKKQIILQLLL